MKHFYQKRMNLKHRYRFLFLLLGVIMLYLTPMESRADTPGSGPFLLVNAPKATIEAGTKTQLTAEVANNPRSLPLTWKSLNAAVATVTQTGLVTGVKEGRATICAQVGTTVVKTGITVTPSSLKLSQTAVTLTVGQTKTLTVTKNGSSVNATWKSLNAGVAAVNASGIVTAKAAGQAAIIATVGEGTVRCLVTVKDSPVRLSLTSLTLNEGDTKLLAAAVNGKRVATTWKSLNSPVASIDSSGLVTAKKPGTATIVATTASGTARCSVTVNALSKKQKALNAYKEYLSWYCQELDPQWFHGLSITKFQVIQLPKYSIPVLFCTKMDGESYLFYYCPGKAKDIAIFHQFNSSEKIDQYLSGYGFVWNPALTRKNTVTNIRLYVK